MGILDDPAWEQCLQQGEDEDVTVVVVGLVVGRKHVLDFAAWRGVEDDDGAGGGISR